MAERTSAEERRPLNRCIITGKIAGHPDTCGDCDPCLMPAHPEGVAALIREIEHWRDQYGAAMADRDEARAALARSEAEAKRLRGALGRVIDCDHHNHYDGPPPRYVQIARAARREEPAPRVDPASRP